MAFSAITAKDWADANVTFNPYARDSDYAEWVEAGATSILGTSRYRMTVKSPVDKTRGIYRIVGRYTRPNVVDGALDGVLTCNFEILRPANLSFAFVNEGQARFASLQENASGFAILTAAMESGALPLN